MQRQQVRPWGTCWRCVLGLAASESQ